jgi:uncharacterized membrane protein
MGRVIDSFIGIYLVIGLASYSVGLLTIAGLLSKMEARGMSECGEPVFYGITGLISIFIGVYFIIKAIGEAIKEAIEEVKRD